MKVSNTEHRRTYLLSGLPTDVKYQSPVTFAQTTT